MGVNGVEWGWMGFSFWLEWGCFLGGGEATGGSIFGLMGGVLTVCCATCDRNLVHFCCSQHVARVVKILYVRPKWPECVCSQSARTWWSTLLYRLLLRWHMFWESMHSPDFTRFQQLTRAKIPVPCYLKCCNRKWGNHGTEIFRWSTEYLFLHVYRSHVWF